MLKDNTSAIQNVMYWQAREIIYYYEMLSFGARAVKIICGIENLNWKGTHWHWNTCTGKVVLAVKHKTQDFGIFAYWCVFQWQSDVFFMSV